MVAGYSSAYHQFFFVLVADKKMTDTELIGGFISVSIVLPLSYMVFHFPILLA